MIEACFCVFSVVPTGEPNCCTTVFKNGEYPKNAIAPKIANTPTITEMIFVVILIAANEVIVSQTCRFRIC